MSLLERPDLASYAAKSHLSRGRKYKVWSEYYDRIFGGQAVEPFIVSTKITKYVADWIRAHAYDRAKEDLLRTLAKKGVFHLARIASHSWRGNDEWGVGRDQLRCEIDKLEADLSVLDPPIETAFAILEDIIAGNKEYALDIDRALKSYTLDGTINSKLYA